MIKQYIKQALRMIGENKLLSVISILGTALAICMIMVIVILYVVNTASFKPEVNRGRTCYITTVMSNGKDDNRRISYSSLGLPLVKECCYPLKGAEAVTAINMDRYRPLTASSMDGLKNRTSYISYTDKMCIRDRPSFTNCQNMPLRVAPIAMRRPISALLCCVRYQKVPTTPSRTFSRKKAMPAT